jgi:deoxyadenosine/deoxycytidine kinase
MPPKNTTKHIAVAGNIGSGRTILTACLQNNSNGNLILRMLTIIHTSLTFMRICHVGPSTYRYFLNNRIKNLIDRRGGKETKFRTAPLMKTPTFLPPTFLIWAL